jgi:predicted dehydrogenase
MARIGVGVIGASPRNPGWAAISHLPALASLPDYELRAVATSSEASALAAGEAYGVPAHVGSSGLIAQKDVDLVVVGVKLPYHYDLTIEAIAAGKTIMCEWPLATDLAQTRDIAERIAKAGLPSLIGLQARMIPAIRHLRALVADGYVGEVLSTSIVGAAEPFGAVIPSALSYVLDVKTNASLLSVPVMHALDVLQFVLGDVAEVRAIDAVRRPRVTIKETGETISATTPDHLALAARLESGALLSLFYRGGKPRAEGVRWEIHGTQGDLVLTSPAFMQSLTPTLLGARGGDALTSIDAPAEHDLWPHAPTGPAANVARLYAAFAKDLRTGTPGATTPDFAHALRLHELQDRISQAAASGRAQTIRS